MRKLHKVKLTKNGEERIEIMDGPKRLIEQFYKRQGYKVEILHTTKLTYVTH